MATIGHGYGSEFHLLRLLGRHRTAFTRAIEDATGLPGIECFDLAPHGIRKVFLDVVKAAAV